MYKLQREQVLLIIFLFSLTVCHNTTQPDSERVIYITADSDTSKGDCPAEQCHSLMTVLKNQSHYFDSNTTLEIFPGTYYITEKIGQLVITEVNNFKIQGSSLFNGRPNATIMCQLVPLWDLPLLRVLEWKFLTFNFSTALQ